LLKENKGAILIFQVFSLYLFLFILIFVHELGHFFFALLFGIKVRIFSIGLGPKIIGIKFRETHYKFCLFPIGGRVALLGENPSIAKEIDQSKHFESYYHKSPWKRILVAFGGPLFNIIFAVTILVCTQYTNVVKDNIQLKRAPIVVSKSGEKYIISYSNKKIVLNGSIDDADYFKSTRSLYLHPYNKKAPIITVKATSLNDLAKKEYYPVDLQIDKLDFHSISYQVGILPKDIIVSINDFKFLDFTNLAEYVKSHKGLLRVSVWQEGVLKTFSMSSKDGKLGIYSAGKYMDVNNEILKKTSNNKPLIQNILEDYIKLFKGNLALDKITGPLQIGKLASSSIDFGLAFYIYFMGIISLNLAIINLLPIPILDGGHIFFYTLEIIFKKRPSLKFYNISSKCGLFLVLGMVSIALYNDITQLISS